jgi:hypothetical protein
VRSRSSIPILRGASIALLSAALVISVIALIGYSRQRNNYPPGMTIAGVPVGGVNPQIASERVLQVYSSPIEVLYGEATIHIDPSVVGFELNMDSMIAAADLERTGGSFWGGFWNYLWNRDPEPVEIPLSATIAEEQLITYLRDEISARYDEPPTPAQPVPGGTTFTAGNPGTVLDINRAVRLLEDTLRSPGNRSVVLSFQRSPAARPTFENLEILLQQNVTVAGFDGVLGLYLFDLQTGQEIHFAMDQGRQIPVNPDVSFTSSSTVKIPIMVSPHFGHDPQVGESSRRPVDGKPRSVPRTVDCDRGYAEDRAREHLSGRVLLQRGVPLPPSSGIRYTGQPADRRVH